MKGPAVDEIGGSAETVAGEEEVDAALLSS
jgi:hypothetical protein